MAKSNRTCIACKTKYSYCPSCSRADAIKPTWYSEFCSEACKDLWITLTKYNMSMLSKEEARAIILNLDLKPIVNYVDCVKRDYAKVTTEDKKPKRGSRIKIKPVDDAMIVDESHEVVLTENK